MFSILSTIASNLGSILADSSLDSAALDLRAAYSSIALAAEGTHDEDYNNEIAGEFETKGRSIRSRETQSTLTE